MGRHAMQAMEAEPGISANAAMSAAQDTAVRLAEQGYVVFNKTSVVAVPEVYEVP